MMQVQDRFEFARATREKFHRRFSSSSEPRGRHIASAILPAG